MKKLLKRTSSLVLAIALFSCVTNSISTYAGVNDAGSSKQFNIGDIKANASVSYVYHSSASGSTSCYNTNINYLYVQVSAVTSAGNYGSIAYRYSPGEISKTVYNSGTIGVQGYHYGEAYSGTYTGYCTTQA